MNAASLHNERALLAQLKEGSAAAFSELYRLYSEQLYYNILAMVKDGHAAEELLQEIFTDIWQKRAGITVERGFAGYLFVAGRNRVYDFFRKAARDRELLARISAIATQEYSHIEEALLAKENADLLQRAIASLPPQRRRAFELCRINGLSYKEASIVMGVSLSTVKDHLANAREAIRAYVASNREMGIGVALFILFQAR